MATFIPLLFDITLRSSKLQFQQGNHLRGFLSKNRPGPWKEIQVAQKQTSVLGRENVCFMGLFLSFVRFARLLHME